MAPLNILVVGCGIAGPTLATFLLLTPLSASEKPHITILERSSTPGAHGQNIDIRDAGITIVRKLGLEGLIRVSLTGEIGVKWVDERNREWATIGAGKIGEGHTPTAEIEITRGKLADICWRNSKLVSEGVKKEGGAGIEYVFGDYLEDLEQDGSKVKVLFAKSKERRSYDVVVGADGLQSRTRRMTWGAEGEKDRLIRLGMYNGFFSMPPAPTDSMWRRWFHASGRRGIMLRPDKPRNRTTVSIYVINETDKRFPEVAAKGRQGLEEQKDLLEEYFRDAGWESPRVLKEMRVAEDFYYDMIGQVKMDRWSKGRVVLLGDAGYCASPISGMGTTLALNGSYNLAGALLRHPTDPTAAFDEYENKMRPLVARAQKLVPGAPHIFSPETVWGVWFLNVVGWLLALTQVSKIIFRLIGTEAEEFPVEDYGFRQLPERSLEELPEDMFERG